MIRSYKDLDVWKKAIELTKRIYMITKGFPKEEMYGLISQMYSFLKKLLRDKKGKISFAKLGAAAEIGIAIFAGVSIRFSGRITQTHAAGEGWFSGYSYRKAVVINNIGMSELKNRHRNASLRFKLSLNRLFHSFSNTAGNPNFSALAANLDRDVFKEIKMFLYQTVKGCFLVMQLAAALCAQRIFHYNTFSLAITAPLSMTCNPKFTCIKFLPDFFNHYAKCYHNIKILSSDPDYVAQLSVISYQLSEISFFSVS